MKAMRESSLDVLRGLAILGMVLSGTISRNPDLPAWLYHAQIAPPEFKFNPGLPGITWVDLVFPFFLFAMGMAFPFAMNKLVDQTPTKIIRKIILRSSKLFFFAVMLGHLSPFHYPQEMGWLRYFLGLISFAGFFLAFAKFPHLSRHENKLNITGYALLIGLCALRVYVFDLPFSVHRNDIIILVLANMALFGALIWLFTRQNWYLRIGIMALYFSLRLTHSIDDSWNKMIWDFTPFKWIAGNIPLVYNNLLNIGIDLKKTIFYNPEYLKYLMIIIPGTIAGDLVNAGLREKVSIVQQPDKRAFLIIPLIIFANLALNLWGLLSRNLDWVWTGNILTVILLWFMTRRGQIKRFRNFRQLICWSIFWLLLGLIFEAWEGGIKKDHATISYFFLTSGLSGLMIVFFKILEPVFRPGKFFGFIGQTGMNPMLGYVAAAYLIMPVLFFVKLLPWMDQWHEHRACAGLIRGIVLTALMVLVTVFSVKKKYFWKT
jgi:predicted acyltransferase